MPAGSPRPGGKRAASMKRLNRQGEGAQREKVSPFDFFALCQGSKSLLLLSFFEGAQGAQESHADGMRSPSIKPNATMPNATITNSGFCFDDGRRR